MHARRIASWILSLARLSVCLVPGLANFVYYKLVIKHSTPEAIHVAVCVCTIMALELYWAGTDAAASLPKLEKGMIFLTISHWLGSPSGELILAPPKQISLI
jgi:hypothetical protein